MKKLLMMIWLLAGIYFIVASVGGGSFICSAMAMVCGFMVARNLADVVPPDPAGGVDAVGSRK